MPPRTINIPAGWYPSWTLPGSDFQCLVVFNLIVVANVKVYLRLRCIATT